MKFKLCIAGAALLAMAMAPAWALQLGQIQIKSALNQPLVAAIPLHPNSLTELDGLEVGLASADDFARAGLQRTPTDQTLRFHVVTDNNGQKLILVTSSQPITDPYLDFLVQVNTRQGKQVREFVVLLNPVIAAPAPEVQTAPVANAPSAALLPSQPAQPPAPAGVPQPSTQPRPEAQVVAKPRAEPFSPSPSASAAGEGQPIPVHRGDTLYGIATEASEGTGASINQMMLALKAANPEAFFKDNINDLKAGAILRIPTRDEISRTSLAEANAEVHRQYETWRAAKPHPATVIEGAAAQAAANAAPQPGPATTPSDHLALVPPTGGVGGASNRPGVAGGTGSETVSGLRQALQNERSTLISLDQSNTDLESRVRSLKDIAGKTDKLLSLKDATLAELQQKLADIRSGKPGGAGASSIGGVVATARAARAAAGSAPKVKTAVASAAKPATTLSRASTAPWFARPLNWIVAIAILLALILIGFLLRRQRGNEAALGRGPLADPEDVSSQTATPTPAYAASLQAQLVEDPDNIGAHLALCRLRYAQRDAEQFVAAAEAMYAHIHDPGSLEWHEVAVMGEELAPGHPLFAAPAEADPEESHGDPYGLAALRQPAGEDATVVHADDMPDAEAIPDPDPEQDPPMADVPLARIPPMPDAQRESVRASESEPAAFNDDPVDTKLDLARAYMDMGDPVGARAMLDEVIEEGTQTQKDEARRLLAETSS